MRRVTEGVQPAAFDGGFSRHDAVFQASIIGADAHNGGLLEAVVLVRFLAGPDQSIIHDAGNAGRSRGPSTSPAKRSGD